MSTTVSVGGFELTSNHETSESMLDSMAPTKEDAPEPKLLVDEGKPVESEKDPAAVALGKKGGEAAAKAREAKAKEAKPEVTDGGSAVVDDSSAEADRGKGNPRHDPKARVAEATREAREARERLEAERAELARERAEKAQLRAELEAARRAPAAESQERAARQPQRQQAQDDDPEPKEEDFAEYKDYVKEVARWGARQQHAQIRQTEEARQGAQRFHESVTSAWGKHTERITAAGGEDFLADFDPKILEAMKPTFSLRRDQTPGPLNVMTDEIIRSEHGPGMMSFLKDNPEEFQRIASLQTPLDVAREMAKIEYRLSAANAGTSVKAEVSRAKPPVRPVTGAPNIAEPELTGEVSFDDFARRRSAQKAKASR
jgi:hypothetical protein